MLTGWRILLVEDEALVAYLLEDMLADVGCTVVGLAARVDQALELIRTIPIDAAVLDVCLDNEFSYPIADALLARGIPFMFSTGYARDRLRDGYKGFPMLQKPYHPRELEKILTTLLPTIDALPATSNAAALIR
uniref:Response regulator receiver protein n=1 Tax=Caulobacter sp. (strain K31) TaxID=366602 RepID=B0T6I7_CAUSK